MLSETFVELLVDKFSAFITPQELQLLTFLPFHLILEHSKLR